jgi:hypothetical protein
MCWLTLLLFVAQATEQWKDGFVDEKGMAAVAQLLKQRNSDFE